MSDTYVVYQHVDATGAVLYAGCSRRLAHRTAQHKYRSAWFSQVARVEVVSEHSSYYRARQAEAELIRDLQPPYNVRKPMPEWWAGLASIEGLTVEERAARGRAAVEAGAKFRITAESVPVLSGATA